MTIDLSIRLVDLIQLLLVVSALATLILTTRKKVQGIVDAAASIPAFKLQLDMFEKNMTSNIGMVVNSISSLDHKIAEADEKFVRRDVHQAELELLKTQLTLELLQNSKRSE
jgi:hypothetical protein